MRSMETFHATVKGGCRFIKPCKRRLDNLMWLLKNSSRIMVSVIGKYCIVYEVMDMYPLTL